MITEMKQAVVPAKEKFSMNGNRRLDEFKTTDSTYLEETNLKNKSQQNSPTQYYDSQTLMSMNRKAGTARSLIKTTERVLYQKFDVDALRIAARDGDTATASRVLDVRPSSSDAQTLYNAAKGGHDAIINLLFALGDFDPDPEPLEDLQHEFSTPILAAIGKDHHLEVIKLFLGNSRFNPARRIRGETYYEIARRRAGPKWKEESMLLKGAFEAYQKLRGITSSKVHLSGNRRDNRLSDSEYKKNLRYEDDSNSRSFKYTLGQNMKDREIRWPQHRKRLSLGPIQDGLSLAKQSLGRIKSEDDSPGALSEPELSLSDPSKQKSQGSKINSEIAMYPDNRLTFKPRRKLLSRKALKDERELERALEKLRRERCTSTNSVDISKGEQERPPTNSKNDLTKVNSSSNEERTSHKHNYLNHNEKESTFDKYISEKEKHRSNVKPDTKDRLTSNESSIKKHSNNNDSQSRQENKENFTTNYSRSEGKLSKKRKIEVDKHNPFQVNNSNTFQGEIIKNAHNPDMHVKKSLMIKRNKSPPIKKENKSKENIKINNSSGDRNSKILNVEASNISSKQMKKNIDTLCDHTIKPELLPTVVIELKDVKEKKNYDIEDKRHALDSTGNGFKGDRDRNQSEGIELKNQKHVQDLEHQKKNLEEQRLLYQEQERLKREEQDRRRANMIEQQHLELIRIEEENIQKRQSKLPLLLKWFDQTLQPKTADIARLFSYIVGYRYDSVNTEAIGKHGADDPWMLNTHAAILLGEKDLQLSRYTAWERLVLTTPQKRGVWSTFNGIFLLLDGSLSCLRQQLPIDTQPMHEVIEKNKKKFLELDLFLVKVTEFMYIVPNFPHLRGIKMAVIYRELRTPIDADQLDVSSLIPGWQQNLQSRVDKGFAPLPKYYIDGVIIDRIEEAKTRILEKPPPLDRFPRRMGLTRVYPEDSDYDEICKNQKSSKLKNSIIS
ncbi:putative ankyrin repeat protein [Erysiphe neolycopersici]|uniref:Putative ankyrin repeat protein n=1 Tax=Erysiphe neolycopersici TaxID=212602 RepID=A0A420HRR8_9PEZI|nr:putative ankyrin repeat protein [Erysiphe neolycopersici]